MNLSHCPFQVSTAVWCPLRVVVCLEMRSDSVYLDVLTARRLGWTKRSLDFLDLYNLYIILIMIIRIYNHYNILICVCRVLFEWVIDETLCISLQEIWKCYDVMQIHRFGVGNHGEGHGKCDQSVMRIQFRCRFLKLSVSCLQFVVISLLLSSLRCFYLAGTAHYKSCCCSVR